MGSDGEIGQHRYEIGVYKGRTLQGVFSTDSYEKVSFLEREANSRKEFLQGQNPGEEYSVGHIKGVKIKNMSCP